MNHEDLVGVSSSFTEVTSAKDINNSRTRRLPSSLRGSIDEFKRSVNSTVSGMFSRRQSHDDDSWMFRPIEKAILLFVQRKIFQDRPIYCELSKRDFESILLKEVGPYQISSDFVDHLFAECDTKNNGFIGVEQLTSYIHRIKPSTKWRARYYVISRILTSFSVWGLLLFVSGSMLSTMNSLLPPQGQVPVIVAGVTMWFLVIGALLFLVVAIRKVWEEEAHEKEALDEESGAAVRANVETTRKSWLPHIVQTDVRVAWLNVVRNLFSVDRLIVFCWILGSALFRLAAYAQKTGMKQNVEKQLWGLGGILYLIGGLLSVPSAYMGRLGFLVSKFEGRHLYLGNEELTCLRITTKSQISLQNVPRGLPPKSPRSLHFRARRRLRDATN